MIFKRKRRSGKGTFGNRRENNSKNQQNTTGTHRRLMLALEPRFLYDAAGLIAGMDLMGTDHADSGADGHNDDAISEAVSADLPADLVAPAVQTPSSIVFVDAGVDDYDTLVNGIDADTLVVQLSADTDGISQITEVLSQFDDIEAVHIISHGASGEIVLGSTALSTDTIDDYAAELRSWSDSLTAGADILIYGCSVSEGPSGQAFVAELSDITGADVAASDDLTGAAASGGDWELETRIGLVESTGVITETAANAYSGLLANYEVTNTNDSGAGSLRDALSNAGDGDTISFNAALDGQTITLTSGSLSFSSNVTIDNDGITGADDGTADVNVTISGNNSHEVFVNSGYSVTLDGLAIQNGYTLANGGAIYNSGDLTIEDSAISNSYSGNNGGGIYNKGTLTVYNSTISGNYAVYGGGIWNSGSLHVDGASEISGNDAGYAAFGKMYIYSSVGRGGGIYNAAGGNVTITGSTISGNFASYYGGGIWNSGSLDIDGASEISDNDAGYGFYYKGFYFSDGRGGGIYNAAGGNVTIAGSTISGNTAMLDGGGIWNKGILNATTGSTIVNNEAGYPYASPDGGGGGIYNHADGTATITGSTISGNTAIFDGGGIWNAGSANIYGSTISKNTAYYDGSGIWSSGDLTLQDSTSVAYNMASGGYSRGGGIFISGGTAAITASTIASNAVAYEGGGIWNNGTTTITNSTISDNYAGYGAGGILNNSGSLTVTNSTISDNDAMYGGGLWNFYQMTITGSTISGNYAGYYGGGLGNAGTLTIYSSTISGNSAGISGGGIWNNGAATITNSTISGNSAGISGGGIYNETSGTLYIYHNTIAFNTATAGAGIYNAGNSGIYIGHTIVADDVVPGTMGIQSSGHNLFAQTTVTGSDATDILAGNADLQALADNGGPTRTHALGTQSDALNAGNPSAIAGAGGIPANDQRGASRIIHGAIDIGAVERSNTSPVASDDTATTNAATVLAVAASGVLANDTDDDNDTLVVQSVDTTGTLGSVTVNSDGSFTYDPNSQFESLAVGETATDTFTYTVSDGNGGTDTATVTITVMGTGVNGAPTAVDDVFVSSGSTVSTTGNVLVNDTYADTSDTLTVIDYDAQSAHGAAVTVNADGSFTYDPTASADLQTLAAVQTVTDTFTYTISDGNGGTDTATVTIVLANWRNVPMGESHVEISTVYHCGEDLLQPGGRVMGDLFGKRDDNPYMLERNAFAFQPGKGGPGPGFHLPDDLDIKDGEHTDPGDGSGPDDGNNGQHGVKDSGPVSEGLHDQLRLAAGWFEQERAAFVEKL